MTETVNHPAHYGGDTTYEVIKVLEAWGLDKDFLLGNTVKYVARAEHKGSQLEDLKKARWYLDRKISNLEKEIQRVDESLHSHRPEEQKPGHRSPRRPRKNGRKGDFTVDLSTAHR